MHLKNVQVWHLLYQKKSEKKALPLITEELQVGILKLVLSRTVVALMTGLSQLSPNWGPD